MDARKIIMAMGTAAMLVACATPGVAKPQANDADFVRGCWVEKDDAGRAQRFLRLLPDSPAGTALRGEVWASGDHDTRRDTFVFSRDGGRASADTKGVGFRTFIRTGYRLIRAESEAVAFNAYRAVGDSRETLLVEVENVDRLIIVTEVPGVSAALFRGERDGCD